MKYLFRTLFAIALLCGCFSVAKASELDFRMTILDPQNACLPGNTACFVYNPGQSFNVALSADECSPFGLGAGLNPKMYGCLVLDNVTTKTINSLTLSFLGAPLGNQPADCDSQGQDGIPSALNVVSCSEISGKYSLNFAGGAGIPFGSDLIVFEEGANPENFKGGMGSVGVTPEPDSLLLFGTGLMMGCMYLSRRLWISSKKISSDK